MRTFYRYEDRSSASSFVNLAGQQAGVKRASGMAGNPVAHPNRPRQHLAVLVLVYAAFLSAPPACAADIHGEDPFESFNRDVHEFNKGLDRGFLRPSSRIYGRVVPRPVDRAVNNFAAHMRLPLRGVNNALQADFPGTFATVGRFSVNTLFGVAGILDPASGMNIDNTGTDFGATLHVWGAGQGAYVELPFFGPSSVRDATGRIVDLFIDPVPHLLPGRYDVIRFSVSALDRIGDRNELGDFVDSMLYDSMDSYVVIRDAYLQSRRRQLNRGLLEEDLEDPYAE